LATRAPTTLAALQRRVVACRSCSRLVRHREAIARQKRRQYSDWEYWGRPVPGFGDPGARLVIVGLAPAAHGANRTGRMFTGDRSGDWLYAALHAFGFSNRAESAHRGDGLTLSDAYVTAVVRCAPPGNKPAATEISVCRPFLVDELALLRRARVVVALGKIAFDGYLAARLAAGQPVPRPRPRFGHGVRFDLGDIVLMASYHPSQQNTFTGKLSRDAFHAVFARVKAELGRDCGRVRRITKARRSEGAKVEGRAD
jgi:uracil-DNA glycosylase family 4